MPDKRHCEGSDSMKEHVKINRFSTQRLDVRDMSLEDCGYAASEWGHPVFGHYMADPMYENGEALMDILRDDLIAHEQWDTGFYFSVFMRESNDIVGTACAFEEKEAGVWGIGYSISHELWGQGLASELIAGLHSFVKKCGAKEVVAKVAQKNVASVKACIRNGMHIHSEGQFSKSGTDIVHLSYEMRKEL